ncbi:MAG: putative transposase [Polyangiales bacterium]
MRGATTTLLPLGAVASNVRWFSLRGCVVRHDDGRCDVLVGGTLVGSYEPGDLAARDVILVTLAAEPTMHLGLLAKAFGLSRSAMDAVRAKFAAGGLQALVVRRSGAPKERLDARAKAGLAKLFEEGLSITEAHARVVSKRRAVSRATVGREKQRWEAARAKSTSTHATTTAPQQLALIAEVATPADAILHDDAETTDDQDSIDDDADVEPEPRSARHVQHLGAWLMVAMVAQLGLHASASEAARDRVSARRTRLAIDATVIALAIGEPTIEGVRRLSTSTSPTLLRTTTCPGPEWIRHTFRRLCTDAGGALMHWRMLQRYLVSERTADERPAVFYVDNHLRPYHGQETLRRGWRMQDRSVVAGVTDYYVHDESGCPLWREAVAHHGSLTDKLRSIAAHLRLGFDDDQQRVLLAFDRVGAFPGPISELRDAGVDFVTYERKPYPLLAKTVFDQVTKIDGDTVHYHEARTNLGAGRGRVRRISFLTDDGRQINLLASSSLPAEELINIQWHRWCQENGFKHGVERWGINQLDARKTEPYPPNTVVPNPARRRLDHALRLLAAREGKLRCALVEAKDDARRAQIEADISAVSERRLTLKTLRATTPKRAPLSDTELAGELVHHVPDYKILVDTIRIACANAEAELAAMIAPTLPKPAEAKRLLRTIFNAPGRLTVGVQTLTLHLDVAATPAERDALEVFATAFEARRLALPGGRTRKTLRVRFTIA